ncbi:MAG: winged helix-turn-helix domain-containing protein, partial [Acidobacteriota bacterium]
MVNERLRIKHWLVDPAAGTIEHGATVRRLDPKTMAVLCHLASKPGEAVTKGELVDAVWDGAAVSDDALTSAVSALRKALGDSARQPEFVRTLPRVGYTLVTPVRREA